MSPPFSRRAQDLPVLGLGLSTEYGAAASPGALDPLALHDARPDLAAFLEVGVETVKGLDATARAWAGRGLPTTYHFLDVNLDEPEDLGIDWLVDVRALARVLNPAWLCGDAGLWHFGPRDRGHMLLLPPILTEASARDLAPGIVALREATELEVLPENPPGSVFLGDLHLLDFFARLADLADTGLVLDVAHLAIYQRVTGRQPLDGLADLDPALVVEIHVAGGVPRDQDGFLWVDDDHGTEVLPDTWRILEWLVPRATNLRAVVFECERNSQEAVLPVFERLASLLRDAPLLGGRGGR